MMSMAAHYVWTLDERQTARRCPRWCEGCGSAGLCDENRRMTNKPVNLTEALASFDEIYSPRIVARMNDYDVRIAHTLGEHVWHVHDEADEFFLVLDGK